MRQECRGRQIGGIEIADRFSLVEVPEEMAGHVIASLSRTGASAGARPSFAATVSRLASGEREATGASPAPLPCP